jgi:phage gpG-like protein
LSIKIKVEGITELREALTNLEVQFDEALENALSITILEARNRVIDGIAKGLASGRIYEKSNPQRTHQASAPGQPPMTDTGALVRSIKVDFLPGSAMVGSPLAYAAYLEYGTRKMAPRPLWLPVAEAIPPILRENIEIELASVIK